MRDVSTLDQLQAFALDFSKTLKPGMWVRLEGDLGAGKTTFARFVIQSLGYDGPVTSPTYTLMREYEIGNGMRIIHIDGYRLDGTHPDPWDASEWGDAIVFVEWPERTKLPANRFDYQLSWTFQNDGAARAVTCSCLQPPPC